jgi:hypothetical protein
MKTRFSVFSESCTAMILTLTLQSTTKSSFEVFTTVWFNILFFWDITLCHWVISS